MRIFLSYGHDAYASLAMCIKRDLEAQLHEVWFDLDRLKPGPDWERYIEDGLDFTSALPDAGRFLLLMTPHSVRRPDGYCLNELARAFARNLPIIPVMISTVEPPLSICRLQWLDMRSCYPAEQHEEQYRKQFERLVNALEEKQVPFEGVQQRLLNYLQPITYDEISRHLSRFTGREWLMAEVQAWLDSSRRMLWITGEAGVGKSAIAAWLCDKRAEVSAYHFCHFGNTDRTDVRRTLCSLAYQLSTQLPVYRDRLNASPLEKAAVEPNVFAVFDRLFVNLLTDGVPHSDKPHVMLIDGLDEMTDNDRNELASLIGGEFDRLPPWLRVIVTSRPHEQQINSELQVLVPWKLDAGREENIEDIRTYLYRELRRFEGDRAPSDEVVDNIVTKSEGLFLYVSLVREELEKGRLSLARLEEFPQGLGGVYLQWFERYFPDIASYRSDCRPALEAICASREPLPRNYLEQVMSWPESGYKMDELVERLGSLFPFIGEDERVRPVHQSLRDWLTDRKRSGAFRADIPSGERRLAEFAWQQYQNGVGSMSRYSVVYGPSHLRQAHRESEIARLLLDFEWLRAKLVATNVQQLIADYKNRRDDPLSRLVGDAIQLSAQVLEDDPGQLAEQLIARLSSVESGPIQSLLAQARHLQVSRSWLEPILSSLSQAGEPLERTITSLERTTRGPERISSLAITPDASVVLAGGPSHLTLWDVTTGQATKRIEIDSSMATAITPDGSRAAAAGSRGFVIWDLISNKWHTVERPGHFPMIAITPDGKRVIACSRDGELQVWDFEKRRKLRSWYVDDDWIHAMALSPDGLLLATAGADFKLEIWEIKTGDKLRTFTDHREVVNALSVSAGGQKLVSGSLDGVLNIWSLQNGQRLCSLDIRSGDTGYGVVAVGLTADGMRAISASDNGTATIWDVNSGAPVFTWRWRITTEEEEDFCGVSEIVLTPDGKRAVSLSHEGDLQLWDLEKEHLVHSVQGHNAEISAILPLCDRRQFVSVANDNKTVIVWDLDAKLSIHRVELPRSEDILGEEDYLEQVAITADGRMVVADRFKLLEIWQLTTQERLRVLDVFADRRISTVAVSPQGVHLLCGEYSGPLELWNLDTLKKIRTVYRRANDYTVAITPDGKYALTIASDESGEEVSTRDEFREMRMWNLQTGELVRRFPCDSSWLVNSLAVTADSTYAVAGSHNGPLQVWDLRTVQRVCLLKRHSKNTYGAVLTEDRHHTMSCSGDEVIVWDLSTGRELCHFRGDVVFSCCACTVDGSILLAGDSAGGVHAFRLHLDKSGSQE